MGNRDSQLAGSCSSASDAHFLDSSTDSSYVSSYVALHQKQQQQQQQLQKKRDSRASFKVPPNLRLSLCSSGTQNSDSDDQTPRSWLQQSPDSPAAASDLCSILNHHHDDQPTVALNDYDSSDKPPVMPRCACRRSLSTGTGDQQQQQQQQQQRTAPLLLPQRPRILPIVRNGRQLSDDIYWVLPPRRKQQQLDEQRLSSSSALEDHTCCQPASFCGPGCTPLELVRRVTSEVFGVTDEESYMALSLHHWDTEKASRYLKIEQLFRLGVCDRLRCQRLLEMHSWKLDSVVQQLSRQRLCRSESH